MLSLVQSNLAVSERGLHKGGLSYSFAACHASCDLGDVSYYVYGPTNSQGVNLVNGVCHVTIITYNYISVYINLNQYIY